MDFGGGDQIRFETRGLAGIVTLTRPDALTRRVFTAWRPASLGDVGEAEVDAYFAPLDQGDLVP